MHQHSAAILWVPSCQGKQETVLRCLSLCLRERVHTGDTGDKSPWDTAMVGQPVNRQKNCFTDPVFVFLLVRSVCLSF